MQNESRLGTEIYQSRSRQGLDMREVIKIIKSESPTILTIRYFTAIEEHGKIPNSKLLKQIAWGLDIPYEKLANLAIEHKVMKYQNKQKIHYFAND